MPNTKHKSQFHGTMGALEVCESSAHKSEIEELTILFKELKESTVEKLEKPNVTMIKNKEGKTMEK